MPADAPESLSALCDRIEALAEKATPGPWQHDTDAEWNVLALHTADEHTIVTTSGLYADARFLAALDPPTVRRLIAAARAGEGLAQAARMVSRQDGFTLADLGYALDRWNQASR